MSYEVDLQNQLLNQQSATLRAKFAHDSALLKLDAETRLRETSSIIPDIDYRRTQLEVEHCAPVTRSNNNAPPSRKPISRRNSQRALRR